MAKDGKIFLEIYVPGEGRVQQIHVWDSHKNWYIAGEPAGHGVHRAARLLHAGGRFVVLARSAEVRTPRDTLSPNTTVQFVTIPFHLAFHEICTRSS